MQYQPLEDDSISLIVTKQGESQLVSSSLRTNSELRRLRTYALTLLSFELVTCIILMVSDGRLLTYQKDVNRWQATYSLGLLIWSLIYYSYGAIVMYRYHHFGIHLFSWLSYLQYLVLCAIMLLNMVFIIKYSSHDQLPKSHLFAAQTVTVISLCQGTCLAFTHRITFRMLYVIETFKRNFLEQI